MANHMGKKGKLHIKPFSLACCFPFLGLQPSWCSSRFTRHRKRTHHKKKKKRFGVFFCLVFNHLVLGHSGHPSPVVGHPVSPSSWWNKKEPNLSLYRFPSFACHTCETEGSFSWHRESREVKWKDPSGWGWWPPCHCSRWPTCVRQTLANPEYFSKTQSHTLYK